MKENLSKQKLLVIIVSVVLVLLAIGGLTTIFLLNYNGFAPNKPVILDDGSNIYITSSLNDRYEKYRFRFKTSGKEFIIDSEKNVLSYQEIIDKGGELGKEYKVSVAFISEKSGNNSEYSSEERFVLSKYLDSPEVSYSEEDNKLVWNNVENADYYRVYSDGDYKDIEGQEYSLDSEEGGQKTFTIEARSNKLGYKNKMSKTISIEYIRYLSGFKTCSFNKDTKILTATSSEKYDAVYIIIGAIRRDFQVLNVAFEGEEYRYTFDISRVYNDEDLVGICPQNIDEYNLSNGNVIYA